MSSEKILLITTNRSLEIVVKNSFFELGKKFPINIVNNITEAIDRIISNGFTMTILDIRSFNISDEFMSEVIKLNYLARKKLVLLTNKDYTKKLEKIINLDIKDSLIINIYGQNLKEKLQYTYVNTLSKLNPPTHREIVKNIMDEITSIKSSRFYRVLRMMIFFI